ncbi:MAG: winged helix-turn-helix domain-containing protein [Myxococcota bacterium]
MATRVLIIDDDEALAGMLAEYLEAHGLEVETCSRALPGLARLESDASAFDALILDVMLPTSTASRPAAASASRRAADPDAHRPRRRDRSHRRPRARRRLPAKPFSARSCWRDCAPCCAARAPHPRPARACCASVDWRSIATRGSSPSRASRVRSRAINSSCCVCSPEAGRVLSRDQLMQGLRGHALEAFDRSIDIHVSRIRAAIRGRPEAAAPAADRARAGYVFARSQDGDLDA